MQSSHVVEFAPKSPFVRNRATWLCYALTTYFGFALSLIGPLMPFIAEKMSLSFTQVGYHFMLLGVGGVLSSFVGDKVIRRFGDNRTVWGGVILVACALFGIIYGDSLPITLFFTFLYSLGASSIIMVCTFTLARTPPEHSTKAFTESNIAGGSAMIVGPLMVGFIAASVLGWQSAAFLPLIFMGIIAIIFRGVSLSDITTSQNETPIESTMGTDNTRLPILFWVFGTMMFLAVATEFLISSWGANFLTTVVGYDPALAASLISLFALAIVLGRLAGIRILDSISQSRLLMLSLIWVLVTFPIYWLSSIPMLNILGLFLVGLGIGNISPIVIAEAMEAAGSAKDRASARFTLFPSLGNVFMLQLMGILADAVGIQRAYGLVIVLTLIAITLALGIQYRHKIAS
jgi:predicted MFS family arabinose efflux permease